jgi:hypothetical protein
MANNNVVSVAVDMQINDMETKIFSNGEVCSEFEYTDKFEGCELCQFNGEGTQCYPCTPDKRKDGMFGRWNNPVK